MLKTSKIGTGTASAPPLCPPKGRAKGGGTGLISIGGVRGWGWRRADVTASKADVRGAAARPI
eukprot:1190330-Prorocentrum_minimum.AAC.7